MWDRYLGPEKEMRYSYLRAKSIAQALVAIVDMPADIDPLDMAEMQYDPSTTAREKIMTYYDDQLLEWLDIIRKIVSKYDHLSNRKSDIKKLMKGVPIRQVAKEFIRDWEERGCIICDVR